MEEGEKKMGGGGELEWRRGGARWEEEEKDLLDMGVG